MRFKKMWGKIYPSLVFSLILGTVAAQAQLSSVQYVDPFVCTSGDHGQLSPSASLPFGLVKLGAETDPTNQSGYNYASKHIKGFSINRIEGAGCKGAGGNLLVKPGLGVSDKNSYLYDKASESASPGYYTVTFPEQGIKAELSVTNGTGWQKYTYQKGGKAWMMINLGASHEEGVVEHHHIKGRQIIGSVQASSVCRLGKYQFFYDIEIDKNPDSVRSNGSVIWYFFTIKEREVVNVKVSVSSVSPKEALRNRTRETGTAGFEDIRKKALLAWQKKLDKIRVKGKDEYVRLFYTHYYHSLLSPYQLSDHKSSYRGSDGKLKPSPGHTFYHSWSVWDNFRTSFPLLSITEPVIMGDICRSLTHLYRQGKQPWGTPTEPFPTVRTEHSIITLLDCYRKGIKGFDLEGVYPYLKKETAQYLSKSPDQKLEAAYDYWALSQFSGILKRSKDESMYHKKALAYKDIWKEKFMVMNEKSDIMHGDGLYEGTLWQYRWFVPYNIGGIQRLIGGEPLFSTQLSYFFDHQLYNHANEPDIHVPYLFNATSKPYRTQQLVNQILTKNVTQWYGTHEKWSKPYGGRIYKLSPEGYIPEMDDDVGTMSAWYVLASMGIYPACIGEPVYYLSSPIFSEVKIQLAENKVFQILTENLADDSFYIQKALLNGKPLNRCWISHDEIIKGGILKFILGKKPNLAWGTTNQYISQLDLLADQ